MNTSHKLLFGVPIVLGLVFGLGFALSFDNSSTIQSTEISTITLTEQELVNQDLLNNGLTNIDGVWYDQEYLDFQKLAKQLISEGKSVPLQIGGIATAIHYNADRTQILSTQSVHNRVVDQGEDFLIQQAFKEGAAGETADADQIASICVSAEVSFVDTSETKTAANFDTSDNLGAVNNCISDAAVTSTSQTAIIGALTFDAPTHVPATTTITGIAICQGAAATPFNLCADAQAGSSGIMFSQVNIGDVTLASLETVDITYTLDISSAGS